MDEASLDKGSAPPVLVRPNLGIDPNLDVEVAGIDFVPDLVPGLNDYSITLNQQNILVHETGNLLTTVIMARKYKKTREAESPTDAINQLHMSVNPIEAHKLAEIIANKNLIDEVFTELALQFPMLYKKVTEFSVKTDKILDQRKNPQTPPDTTRPHQLRLTEEEIAEGRYYCSVLLDGIVPVMRKLGAPERLYEVIDIFVRQT